MVTDTCHIGYYAPESDAIEFRSQGVLCESDDQTITFNYNDNPGWFG